MSSFELSEKNSVCKRAQARLYGIESCSRKPPMPTNLEAIIRNAIPDIMAQMQQQLEASIARAVQDSLPTFEQQVKTEMVEL